MISRRILSGVTVAVLSLSTTVSAIAADTTDSSQFEKSTDTRLSMEFQKTKAAPKSKSRQIAVYKVLDVQQSAGEITPMPGDIVELSFPDGEAASQSSAGSFLPWAEVKSDGMILLHMPNKYLKKRATTSAETIWRIENAENTFALIKPDAKK